MLPSTSAYVPAADLQQTPATAAANSQASVAFNQAGPDDSLFHLEAFFAETSADTWEVALYNLKTQNWLASTTLQFNSAARW